MSYETIKPTPSGIAGIPAPFSRKRAEAKATAGAKKKAATEELSKAGPGQEITITGTPEETKRAQMALHQWARRHGLKLKTRNLCGRLIAWTEGQPIPYEL